MPNGIPSMYYLRHLTIQFTLDDRFEFHFERTKYCFRDRTANKLYRKKIQKGGLWELLDENAFDQFI